VRVRCAQAAADDVLADEDDEELLDPEEPLDELPDELLDAELSDLAEDPLSDLPSPLAAGALELDEPPRLSVR
jgi:hypothetical protein